MTGLAQIPHSCSPTSTNIREATQARGLQGEYNAFVHKTMKRGSEDLKSSPIPPANSKSGCIFILGAMLFHNSVNSKLCN